VTEERVNFARWRHVDDDTAARFIEALDAMDGATEPMESDSEMNVKSLDSDNDVTSGLHARSKRLEHSVSDTDSFRATRNTVTERDDRCFVCISGSRSPFRPFGSWQAMLDRHDRGHVDDPMEGSGETRWMDDPELPSQILSTPIVPTPNTVEQRNVTKLDVGTSFVTITSSTLGQRDVTQSHFVPTFVTITISREDAEELYGQLIDSPNEGWYSRVFNTVHDALEEER